MTSQLPLEGVRVLDSSYVFALPYTGGLLADLGAEVIKVEGPGRPDVTRTGGYSGTFPEREPGEGLVESALNLQPYPPWQAIVNPGHD